VGVVFVLFASTLTIFQPRSLSSLGALVLLVTFVALITGLNLKFTKFCEKCGATHIDQNLFSPMKFCSKCGAPLGAKPKVDEDLPEF
jgi:hypothetical protein